MSRKKSKTNPGARPIITMILHQDKAKHPIRVLLDTGCSIALINEHTIKKLGIQRQKHQRPRTIENYT